MESDNELDGYDENGASVSGDEDSIQWLEHFTAEAPALILNFYSASSAQQTKLPRETFDRRFSQCLGKPMGQKLPPEMTTALYEMAVGHRQQMDAYEEFGNTLKGAEFTRTLRYVQAELERVRQISELLETPRRSSLPRELLVPQQLRKWDGIWIGSMRELVQMINGQLEVCEADLARQQKYWPNLGRTKIETHLLEIALRVISKQLNEHNLRFDKYWLLVAYAHAALMVSYLESDGRDASVAAMKMRISRVRQSKNRTAMLSLFFAQLAQEQ